MSALQLLSVLLALLFHCIPQLLHLLLELLLSLIVIIPRFLEIEDLAVEPVLLLGRQIDVILL